MCMHTSKPEIRTKTDPEVCYNWNGEEKKSKDHKFFTSAINVGLAALRHILLVLCTKGKCVKNLL